MPMEYDLGMRAARLTEGGKGILAIDESAGSMEKKLLGLGIENKFEIRDEFRVMLLTTPGLEQHVGGVILNEETLLTKAGNELVVDMLARKNILVGVKVDKGLRKTGDENITEGLDDLEIKLKLDVFSKVDFAKWRALFILDGNMPSEKNVQTNCEILAKYAVLCQQNGIVPVVEPELFLEGDYSVEKCERVLKHVLSELARALNQNAVFIPGVVIKTSFVSAGTLHASEKNLEDMARRTYNALLSSVPAGIPSIVFLSGGHTPDESFLLLEKINEIKNSPFKLSFSYGRALTQDAMRAWAGKKENENKAQKIFKEVLKKCHSGVK